MADAYPNPAPLPAHPPRMARPGFGKRSAPAQAPRRKDDFAHLPPREASIAAFIDRLPEGAAMDGKSLAAQLPAYGQARLPHRAAAARRSRSPAAVHRAPQE
ncbi:hypothetical protein GCM10020221_04790 [Streptomyces thioluteus]|uniref:Uncharacterized protein n=1 Tax=Streptomyces thioluteus TaxID=66431 RepID=A0ABP6IX01_STRTU